MKHFLSQDINWHQKVSTFYIKVFELNIQNIVVWGCKSARNA